MSGFQSNLVAVKMLQKHLFNKPIKKRRMEELEDLAKHNDNELNGYA